MVENLYIGKNPKGATELIEKFNANPDSNSGIVTVPKVIGAGENVTIPAGRMAVLPNVQVDGTLTIEGEVFIPSGTTFSKVVETEGNQTIADVKTFTSSPIVPTPTAGDNSTKVATTAYVDGKFIRGTAVATTSGTAIDFVGIPSWVKRITVMFNGVSTNGSSAFQVQLGDSGGIDNTGYLGTAVALSGGGTAVNMSGGFILENATGGAYLTHGNILISNISLNTWVESGVLSHSGEAYLRLSAGSKTLSGTLDRIRVTTVKGTDTFDAGQINIMYEG